MGDHLLKEIAEVAGIGGLSLAIFLSLFREVLRKTIFATLTPEHSYRLMRTILYLVWSMAALGVGAWVYVTVYTKNNSHDGGIERFKNYEVIKSYGRFQLEKVMSDPLLRDRVVSIMEVFDEGKYDIALAMLDGLPDNDVSVRRFKEDFRTGVLFANGDFRGSLESIIKRYDGIPVSDVRYRWDIAYVTYFMRKQLGREEAEDVIKKLRRQYHRADISYVWMGIHPNAFLRLLQSDLHPYQSLDEKQNELLRYVISKYPDDQFLDHAYYFLHDYDTIISKYPKSIIREQAIYARASLRYYKLTREAKPYSPSDLRNIINAFDEFMKAYPRGVLTVSAYDKIMQATLDLPDKAESFDALFMSYQKYKAIRDEYGGDRANEVSRENSQGIEIEEYIRGFFNELDPMLIDGFISKLAVTSSGTAFVDKMSYLVARRFFSYENYEKSYQYYRRLPDRWPLDKKEVTRIVGLELIQHGNDEMGEAKLYLMVGLKFKDSGDCSPHAIKFFDRYKDKLEGSDEEVAKVLMLKAFCYRDIKDGKSMADMYTKVATEYPGTKLADDAIAEVGVYLLLWGFKQEEEARKIFRIAIDRYPNGNAADNSYRWIAWSYLTEGKLKEAKEYYAKIVLEFPGTRHAVNAVRNLLKIDEKLAPKQTDGEPIRNDAELKIGR